ncbi:MAG: Trm112 family protein [Chloroflexi bacterium]|nr:Trm112 family protein [Chloroflexota bacterium]
MHPELLEILACPVCKAELALTVEQTGADAQGREEIVRGELYCAACDYRYRIEEGIPNLLPPKLAATLEGGAE